MMDENDLTFHEMDWYSERDILLRLDRLTEYFLLFHL